MSLNKHISLTFTHTHTHTHTHSFTHSLIHSLTHSLVTFAISLICMYACSRPQLYYRSHFSARRLYLPHYFVFHFLRLLVTIYICMLGPGRLHDPHQIGSCLIPPLCPLPCRSFVSFYSSFLLLAILTDFSSPSLCAIPSLASPAYSVSYRVAGCAVDGILLFIIAIFNIVSGRYHLLIKLKLLGSNRSSNSYV